MGSPRVLLVGWDAADWKVIQPLMDAGKMHATQRLVEQGAAGQIATMHPPLSPMLWTSIATGKRPFQHGIHGFSEPMPDGVGVQPISSLSRKSKALWNILNQNDLRSVVIGWWPSHPAEPIEGVMVSNHYHRALRPHDEAWPLAPDAIHPRELAGTLAALRMHPDLLTPSMVEPFVPLAREIDQDNDKRLGLVLRTLAECMSIQAAAAWLIDNEPWDFFAVYYDAIDHFSHGFMRYHPPRQSWIAKRDFELYQHVVSAAYQLHDQMLAVLLEKAGRDTTVILMSDHGFHPDHLRPSSIPDIPAGPAIEHRDFGILAMSGRDMQPRVRLHGASVLDIAPSILTLFGLPVGEDMGGNVLSEAFAKTPKVRFVPSWEDIPGKDGRHPRHMHLDPVAAHEAMEQMIALGYVERPHRNPEVAVKRTVRELRYNLGEAYQDAGRHLEALDIFTDLCRSNPEEQRFAVRLFVSCQSLGMRDEMHRIADDLQASPVGQYLRAQVLIEDKRYAEAVALLEQVAGEHLLRPGLFLETAELLVRTGRWIDARKVFEDALAIDPDDARAYIGLCRVALHRKEFEAAVQSALDALQRAPLDPVPHFLLGNALTGLQQFKRAGDAYRAAIAMNPNYPEAHARLATLLAKHLGDPATAREHRRLARAMRNGAVPAQMPLLERRGPELPIRAQPGEMPPLDESLVVVTGLPRSGTSMLMQMLAAGGMDIVADESRQADEDNPRGYFEFGKTKGLLHDAGWLLDVRGKAIKIVVPLLTALPAGLPCRVILADRHLDEVLDSQHRMLDRRGNALPDRRQTLRAEYDRMLSRARAMLAQRPSTALLVIEHSAVIRDPLAAAEDLNNFLGNGLDVAKMAAVVDPALHRNREAAAPRNRP